MENIKLFKLSYVNKNMGLIETIKKEENVEEIYKLLESGEKKTVLKEQNH